MHVKVTALKYAEGKLPGALVLQNGSEEDSILASFLYYLIQLDDKNILVDVGGKDIPNYYQHYQKPLTVLQAYGLQAEEIDAIIITHAHHDHIGELLDYPHAVVYLQEDEYKTALANGFITDAFHVQTFENETTLFDVLKLQKVGGHTKGSSIVSFVNGEQEYVLCGDECYTEQCIAEQIPTGNTCNPDNSRRFVETYAAAKYKIFTFHNPNMMPGHNGYQTILECDLY